MVQESLKTCFVLSVQKMALFLKVLAKETQVIKLSTIFLFTNISPLVGGPLMIADDRNSSYTLIGAVSWGWGDCTSQSLPGVHSRITSNIDWITETTAGSNTCPSRTSGK